MFLVRRAFWRGLWILIQRSPRDSRARNAVLKFLLAAVYCLIVAPALLFLLFRQNANIPRSPWMLAFYALLFASAAVMLLWIRRANRLDSETLRHSILVPPVAETQPTVAPAVIRYLEQRARILAALMMRGFGEIVNDPAARQAANSALRSAGLWDKLEPAEADLMSLPSGAWSKDRHGDVIVWSEQLRLLRWVLGLDSELMPLGLFPSPEPALISGLFESREPANPAKVLAPWDVRVEHDTDAIYTVRVVDELIRRGHVAGEPSAMVGERDALAGERTVAELDDESLARFCCTVSARERYAQYLVELLSAREPFPFPSLPA